MEILIVQWLWEVITTKLNAGGSSIVGSEFSGQLPSLPEDVFKKEKQKEELIKVIKNSILNAVTVTSEFIEKVSSAITETGTPITQICQKSQDGSSPLTNCTCGEKSNAWINIS